MGKLVEDLKITEVFTDPAMFCLLDLHKTRAARRRRRTRRDGRGDGDGGARAHDLTDRVSVRSFVPSGCEDAWMVLLLVVTKEELKKRFGRSFVPFRVESD